MGGLVALIVDVMDWEVIVKTLEIHQEMIVDALENKENLHLDDLTLVMEPDRIELTFHFLNFFVRA